MFHPFGDTPLSEVTPADVRGLVSRAIEEGLFDPNRNVYEQAFSILKEEGHSYLTHVFLLQSRLKRYAPKPLIRALASRPARWVGERLPGWLLNGVWNRQLFPRLLNLANREVEVRPGMAWA